MAHTVELPSTAIPVFPDRCLVCARAQPADAIELRAWFNAMQPLDDSVAKIHRVRVPVCPGCRASLVRSRWIGKLVFAVCVGVGVTLIFGFSQLGWVEGWLAYVAILAAIGLPLVVGQLVYTPVFDFSPWSDRLSFEFRSREYADAFAVANGIPAANE